MTSEARPHHTKMKYLLAQMALQNPERFFTTFGPGGDAEFLATLWQGMGQRFAENERVAHDGARTEHRAASGDGPEVLVLVLPTPAARGEAYLLAAVRNADGALRVFCLERALPSAGDAPATMLSEISPEGRANWGPSVAPDVDGLVTSLHALVADRDARPLTFTQIPLA